MPEDLQNTWERVREEMRSQVTDFIFHVWLEPLKPAGRTGDKLFITAPGHVRGWVRERYGDLLRDAAARANGGRLEIELVDEKWKAPATAVEPAPRTSVAATVGLNPKYTFEQFVICEGNRFAHAAALAVAELPGQAYNPLFVHGPPGLGKTHLLHAIGNYIARYGDGLTVRYATVETFTSEFVAAVRTEGVAAFKSRFRGADVLLIDDIQFLGSKQRTEEEFFHTFNALYETGRQLVFTSDRPPAELAGLEARLRERFACGLVIPVETPGADAREAILRKRLLHDNVEMDDDALRLLAESVNSSIRALEGGLIRIVAYASLRGERITADVVEAVLGRLPAPTSHTPAVASLEAIQDAAAAAFDLSRERLLARDRSPKVVLARQIAMYLARELTDVSLPAIGRGFGRDHSTVLHAHKRIAADIAAGGPAAGTVDMLRTRLASRGE
ncbi:MAG TPA: chromosomal replication initiator protein DnaA [Thermoleophilaceae bacterium]|nr:chromosomal replication initiator protein DnaA [Thermoleophilaceae bacterium]